MLWQSFTMSIGIFLKSRRVCITIPSWTSPILGRKLQQTLSTKCFRMDYATLLPVLYKAATILASIPATSCTTERSFSGLRRVKTYLRSTMGEERLNYIAVINIERAYVNRTIKNDMVKIIDTLVKFGRQNGRDSYFF